MKTLNKKNINWDRMKDYIENIFDEVNSSLTTSLSKLGLQSSEPSIYLEGFPPRINISFGTKKNSSHSEMYSELSMQTQKIGDIVRTLAKEQGLEATNGICFEIPENATHAKAFRRDFGDYTIKAKYQNFTK